METVCENKLKIQPTFSQSKGSKVQPKCQNAKNRLRDPDELVAVVECNEKIWSSKCNPPKFGSIGSRIDLKQAQACLTTGLEALGKNEKSKGFMIFNNFGFPGVPVGSGFARGVLKCNWSLRMLLFHLRNTPGYIFHRKIDRFWSKNRRVSVTGKSIFWAFDELFE